ncbi:Myblike DNAbinding domain-containing protein [Coemansia sp. RSA 1822]|nr:Myblike DNAbinding domain-containing protein [Coemansia sp. RSA 1822]
MADTSDCWALNRCTKYLSATHSLTRVLARQLYTTTRQFSTTKRLHLRSIYYEDWTDNDTKKLIDYVNTNYRGKVSGDWDLVVGQIQGVAAKHNAEWTHTELVDLAQYVWQAYMRVGLVIDWDDISHQFGRTPGACRAAIDRHRIMLSSDDVRLAAVTRKDPVATAKREYHKTMSLEEVLSYAHALRNSIEQHTHGEGTQCKVDWDAVAKDTDRSVYDVVLIADGLVHHKLWSGFSPPSTPLEYPHEWSPELLHRMHHFISKHYIHEPPVNWAIVALYMSIDAYSCADAHINSTATNMTPVKKSRRKKNNTVQHQAVKKVRAWTAEEHERLEQAMTHRHVFQQWADVAKHVGNDRTVNSCIVAWNLKQQRQEPALWTDEEKDRLDAELLKPDKPLRHHAKLILSLFPGKSLVQLQAQMAKARSKLHSRRIQKIVLDNPQQLLDTSAQFIDAASGQPDWRRVSQVIGVTPVMCRNMYNKLRLRVTRNKNWTGVEMQRLTDAIHNVREERDHRWQIIAQLVGSRSPTQCLHKAQQQGLVSVQPRQKYVQ